jgi:hypothetical protein
VLGIVHGNHHLANALSSGDDMLWIDFRYARMQADNLVVKRNGMTILIESLLEGKLAPDTLLPASVASVRRDSEWRDGHCQ